ncbi:Hypothetical protein NCS54_00642700 [Fusarium falciforme]|uniref:Hypothetical protein n=1 Tax=Fusarium falciforme TaxID=195108 RepID=UPI002300CF93|nr:Hypothetical protein NCS54_00642700 [Fusarium falciforme]WAO89052.1 Hypothetical protein NCS54_00642700 [Fusarium falciforme]
MPVFEDRPSFLYEVWTLYGVGTLILLTRFAVRFKTVGWRGFQGDDFFSALVLIFFAMDGFTVHLIYYLGTNLEANFYAKTHTLTDSIIKDCIKGSKLEFVAWYSYTALIWSLKGTMLFFFSRITIGTWHSILVKTASVCCAVSYLAVFLTVTFGCFPTRKNWQVVPDPGEKCTFRRQNLVVTTVLNVLTDSMILGIPLPLLWKLQIPLRRKIVIGLLLSSGLFVIAAAIIRATLTLSAHPSALAVNEWGVRETLVGIITVNIPILRPMFKRSFWSWQNNTNISSSFRTTTGAGKSTDITGPYELTPSIAEGSKPSDRGSQESIFKKDSVTMAAVVVKTTYDVTRETAIDEDESWSGCVYDNGWDYGVGSTDAGTTGDGPPAKPEDPKAPEQEYFWPVLRKHGLGQAEPGERPVKCACPICYDHISMAGLSTPEEGGKQGLIAPCGHDPDNYEFTERKCPVCRLLLQCYSCTHTVMKEPIPDATCDVEELECVPNSMTETSVPYQTICVECCFAFDDILKYYEPGESIG